MDMSKVFKSTFGLKYPTLRDHPLHSGLKWLEGKNNDDGAENYWRIYDNLYDLNGFINLHPGGKDWILLSQGTDITEAFESHHLTENPKKLLTKYFLKKASISRNFPFTFHKDDFYCTLKNKITKKLKTLPETAALRSKWITDSLFLGYIITFILSVYFKSFLLGFLSGIFLGLVAIAAHNFFHQRDNFRRFYFDFSMMSSKEWRISHVLSHHMYTNTLHDLEISSLEPFLQYLPGKKSLLVRYGSWVYSFVLMALFFPGHYLKTIVHTIFYAKEFPSWTSFLPFSMLLIVWAVTGQAFLTCFLMFSFIITIGSLYFGFIGVNAAHHHPDLFHDGDSPRPHHPLQQNHLDWGIFQMDAVMDRNDISGSHFLVLTSFGDHALHHLFPTIDHGYLEYLYPEFLDTCKEFGVEWNFKSQIELIKGQFLQLAKVEANKIPRKHLKTRK